MSTPNARMSEINSVHLMADGVGLVNIGARVRCRFDLNVPMIPNAAPQPVAADL